MHISYLDSPLHNPLSRPSALLPTFSYSKLHVFLSQVLRHRDAGPPHWRDARCLWGRGEDFFGMVYELHLV